MEMAVQTTFTPWASLAGGVLIGLSAVMVMGLFGRIAGISGITSGILGAVLPMTGALRDREWRVAFLFGVIAAPLLVALLGGTVRQSVPENLGGMVVAGLLVGFGTALGSPGHTLGSVTLVCGDAAFTHDTLMQPDVGTSRADFPGGNTEQLWASIQAILALPAETRLFVGHDYGTDERDEPMWEATVAEHLAGNKHVRAGTRREDWIARRDERDATLPLPDRILAALQINLGGGRLPPAEEDGHVYLKLPVNRF